MAVTQTQTLPAPFLEDVSKLFKNLSKDKAVYCVKHDYTPSEKHKMDEYAAKLGSYSKRSKFREF